MVMSTTTWTSRSIPPPRRTEPSKPSKGKPAAASLKWRDADEIALRLSRRHPDIDPRTLRFTDLHRRVTELEAFDDDPWASNEQILEAIQMAWAGYCREGQ